MCSKLSACVHAQPLEQREDDQRGQPLRRRRRVVERAGARSCTLSGSAILASIFFQIGARHRAADALQIGGDLAADIAAIEIVEPGLRELLERRGERRLLQLRADLRRLAVDQEGLARSRAPPSSPASFSAREPRLAARHRVALARVLDRRRRAARRAAACRRCALRRLERQHPAADRARHGERGERPARRDFVVAGVAIELRRRLGAGAARAHQRAHAARTARGSARSRRRRYGSCADRPRRSRPPWRSSPRWRCRLRPGWRGRPRRRRHAARRRRRGDGRRCERSCASCSA